MRSDSNWSSLLSIKRVFRGILSILVYLMFQGVDGPVGPHGLAGPKGDRVSEIALNTLTPDLSSNLRNPVWSIILILVNLY